MARFKQTLPPTVPVSVSPAPHSEPNALTAPHRCSLFQKERSDDEDAAFRSALARMQLWYAHMLTTVFLMTEEGIGLSRALLRPSEQATMGPATGGVLTYTQRGWPTFECLVAMLGKRTSMWAWPLIVDVGSNTGSSSRLPPLTPEKFEAILQSRAFTNNSDHKYVVELYRATARCVMSGAQMLKFGGLRWGDEDVVQLCAWLQHSSALTELSLVGNQIGDKGILALVELVMNGCLRSLRRLNIRSNQIGAVGLSALGKAIRDGALPELIELQAGENKASHDDLVRANLPTLPTTSEMRVRRAERRGRRMTVDRPTSA